VSDVLELALHMNRASFVARFPEAILIGDGTLVPPPSAMTMTMIPTLSFDETTSVSRKGSPALPTALICPVRKARAAGPDTITVGRAPDSDILIADESISKVHARFHKAGGVLALTDAGSTNGTWLGDRRLNPGDPPVPVTPGTRLRFAMVAMTLVDSGLLWDRIRAPSFDR